MQLKMSLSKKTLYDKLGTKVNSIDSSRFVFKTKYGTDKNRLENKRQNNSWYWWTSNKTDHNSKITEKESKISSISVLATNSELSTVENKIPDVSTLVKKIDCGTRISKIKIKVTDHNHGKYITTPEFDKLTVEVFSSRLVQENLITKNILILN